MDFFELVWMEKKSLDSRESKKDIIYTSMLHMYLDERDNRKEDQLEHASDWILIEENIGERLSIDETSLRDGQAEYEYPLCRG